MGFGLYVGADVLVEDGRNVNVGGSLVEVSVTVGRSVVGERLHPVNQKTTICKIKIMKRRL